MSVKGFNFDGTVQKYDYDSLDNKIEKTTLASEFTTGKTYLAGDMVFYEGKLYSRKTDGTDNSWVVGNWTETDIEERLTAIEGDVSDLKGDLTQSADNLKIAYESSVQNLSQPFTKNLINPDDISENTSIDAYGREETNTAYITTGFIRVEAGKSYTFSPAIRMYALYDTSTKFSSRDASSSVNTFQPYTVTASADGYIRAVFTKQNKLSMQAEEGSTATFYEPFGLKVQDQANQIETTLNRYGEAYSVNLVNPADISEGKGIAANGDLETNTSYVTTGYIRIYAGKSYTFSPSIRMYATYKDDKSFDVRNQDSSVNTGSPYTFTANKDGYIRAVYWKASRDYMQAEEGSTATPYEPYGLKAQSELDELEEEISPLLATTRNLVDATAAAENRGIAANGDLETNTSYITTDYIKIESGKTYTLSPKIRMYALYNGQKTFSGRYIDSTVNTGEPYTFTASADGFLRASFFMTDKTIMQMEEGSTTTSYVPYGYTVAVNAEEAMKLSNGNVLYGKKWAVCGDSFTYGSESGIIPSGRYAGKNKVYPYFIGNRNNMEILPFFQSGKTLAFPANPGSFVNSLTCPTSPMYYQNIPADVDYITIYLGINDEHHYTGGGDGESSEGHISLGTIDDDTTATYYGAWNVVMTWLRTNRPFAHIGIIITNGLSLSDWYQAQINIAKKYGIPYLDMNGDQRTPAMIRSINPDIASGIKTLINQKQAVNYAGNNLHPNDDAHEYESMFIEDFLRST